MKVQEIINSYTGDSLISLLNIIKSQHGNINVKNIELISEKLDISIPVILKEAETLNVLNIPNNVKKKLLKLINKDI